MKAHFKKIKNDILNKLIFYVSKALNDRRYRKALITSVTNGVGRIISFGSNMVIVRLAFGYLGAELYGLWMAITAFLFFNTFADFGIGNGLTNLVAECYGHRDNEKMKRYISSTFYLLFFIMLFFVLLSFLIIPRLNFSTLLNLTNTDLAAEAAKGTLILAVIFSINISLGVAQRVQSGLQEGYKANIYQFVNSILSVLFVFVAVRLRFPFYGIVLSFSAPQLLANFANNVHLFFIDRPELKPKWEYFDEKVMRKIFGLGFYFFILQLMFTLSYTLDNAIIAKRFTLIDVSNYSIVQRLFTIGPAIQTMILMPLWPAYGEAKAAKDYVWIWKTFTRSFWFSLITGLIAAIGLLLTSKFIIEIWLGKNLYPPSSLLIGFAVWSIVGGVFGGVTSTFFNGLSILKFQMYCGILVGVSSFFMKIYVPTSYGASAIIWSTVIPYVLFIVIPTSYYIYKMKKSSFANVLVDVT